MNFPVGTFNGQTTTVNGVTYVYDSTKTAWKRSVSPIGNLTVLGNITTSNLTATSNVLANKVFTTSGLFWAGNGIAFSSFPTELDANVGTMYLGNIATQANIGFLHLGNIATQANLGTIVLNNATTQANIGTLFLGNASTQANLGAFQTFSNANAATQATGINNINANLGAYQLYANANIGTLFLSNASTQANLGAFQTFSNANAATQATSINTFNANLGAFQTFSNANAATQQTQINNIVTNANANIAAFLPTYTGNIGAGNIVTSGTLGNISGVNYIFATNYVYPNGVSILTGIGGTYSNANVEAYFGANIGSLLVNAATQATSINTINANLGAYQIYANANIGTLFLGNASTQANIGEFYSYANANIGTLFLGNASTQANIGAYQAYANIYLGTATTFTVTNAGSGAYVINSESNPALYLIRGQRYNFSLDASGHPFWIKTAATTGTGDQYNTGVTNNGDDVGLITFEVPLTAPDVLYYICQFHSGMNGQLRIVDFADIDANIGTLFLGNASTQANIGTLFLGNASTQANLGAFQLYANATFSTGGGSSYGNASVAAYLTLGATIGSGSTTANLVAAATTTSTSTTTGALVVLGGAGVAGNVYADKFYTANGIFWSGNGAAYAAGGGGGGSSFTYTASATAPGSPVVGDQWFDTTDGTLYEYIDDGDSDQWVDIQSPTFASNAVVTLLSGDVSTSGNISASSITITSGIFWSNSVSAIGPIYGNTQVAQYLPTFTGALTPSLITNSGNLTVAGNIVQQQAYYETFGNLTNVGGNLTCNFNNGTVFNVTSITANVTANFTNVNAITNSATGAVVILTQGATAYRIANVQVNGVNTYVRWVNGNGSGISPMGLASNTDIVSFSIMHLGSGSYAVFGQLSTFA